MANTGRDETISGWQTISLGCIAIGLALLLWSTGMTEGSRFQIFMNQAASVLMVSGGLRVIFDLGTRKHLLRQVESSLRPLLEDVTAQTVKLTESTHLIAVGSALAAKAESDGVEMIITNNAEETEIVRDLLSNQKLLRLF